MWGPLYKSVLGYGSFESLGDVAVCGARGRNCRSFLFVHGGLESTLKSGVFPILKQATNMCDQFEEKPSISF